MKLTSLKSCIPIVINVIRIANKNSVELHALVPTADKASHLSLFSATRDIEVSLVYLARRDLNSVDA